MVQTPFWSDPSHPRLTVPRCWTVQFITGPLLIPVTVNRLTDPTTLTPALLLTPHLPLRFPVGVNRLFASSLIDT